MIALLSLLVPALADEPVRPSTWQVGAVRLGLHGHLREIVQLHPAVVVDDVGTVDGGLAQLDQRLRLAFDVEGDGLRLALEADVLTGRLTGGGWAVPWTPDLLRRDEPTAVSLDGQLPRRASLTARIPELGVIDVGLMPAHTWGLGILANGGEAETVFGRVDRGDRMLRARVTVAPVRVRGQPVPLYFTFAYDRVVEDDTARLWLGQEADHVIGSILWNDPKGRKLGVFTTWRTQREPGPAPRPTDVLALDLFGDLPLDVGGTGWQVRLAAEGALLTGTTQRVLTYADVTGTDILSGGALARFQAIAPAQRWTVGLDGGFASATGDPDAGTLQDFTFDDNVNVGLVLFDEVQDAVERGTYARIADPANAGRPPGGSELLVTGGSVRRAAFLNPTVVWKGSWASARLGYVAAWSTGPIANPFTSLRAGGAPRNHLGEAVDDRFYGHEIDAGVSFGGGAATAAWPLRPSLDLQGGVGFLGAALGGGVSGAFLGTARFDW